MKRQAFFTAGLLITGLVAMRASEITAPQSLALTAGERTIFNDSVMHSAFCEYQKSEDWRRICVPRDQSVARSGPTVPDRWA